MGHGDLQHLGLPVHRDDPGRSAPRLWAWSAAAIGGLAALEGGGAFAGALIIAALGVRPGSYRRLYFFGTTCYVALRLRRRLDDGDRTDGAW